MKQTYEVLINDEQKLEVRQKVELIHRKIKT
jgi:hypothetical protein